MHLIEVSAHANGQRLTQHHPSDKETEPSPHNDNSTMLVLAALLAVSPDTKASVDLLAAAEPFAKNWQRCVGSGHMLLGTRADWQSQLALAVNELGFGAIRGHGLLDDDMGVLPAKGRLEFYNVDQARTRTHAHTYAHTRATMQPTVLGLRRRARPPPPPRRRALLHARCPCCLRQSWREAVRLRVRQTIRRVH